MSEPEAEPEPDCFYVPGGEERFVPTPWTRGPWSVEHQHAGPPSALLGRALARAAGPGVAPARLWIELRRPVPLAPLRVEVEPPRSGRATVSATARLLHEDVELARASALFVRRAELPFEAPAREPPPSPDGVEPFVMPFFVAPVGYQRAIELRIARGTWSHGPVLAWLRLRCPLVAGEAPSPLERVLCAADSVHGVAPPLDIDRFSFVNPDLAVHLSRLPRGEWVGLDAWTTAEPDGLGLARSTLLDEDGPIGATLQSLVVARRPPRG